MDLRTIIAISAFIAATIIMMVSFMTGGDPAPQGQSADSGLASYGHHPAEDPGRAIPGPGGSDPTPIGGRTVDPLVGADPYPPTPATTPASAYEAWPPITPITPITPLSPVDAGAVPETYTIAAGDTFGHISQRFYGTTRMVGKIQALNPDVDSTTLQAGQVIKLPPRPVERTQADAPSPDGAQVHVVKEGDTFGTIARQHLGSAAKWTKIRDANPGVDPGSLRVGQRLVIPAATPEAAPTAQADAAVPDVPPGGKKRTIKEGEYLQDIAREEYGSVRYTQALVAANPHVNPNRMRVGTVIVVPPRSSLDGAGAGGHSQAPAAGTYTVKAGDLLSTIAREQLGKTARWTEIAALNPQVDPGNLRVGQVLRMPGAVASGTGTGGTGTGGAGAGVLPDPTRPAPEPKPIDQQFLDLLKQPPPPAARPASAGAGSGMPLLPD